MNYRLPRFTIEVNPGSELLVSPNQPARIFFEVTNNRDQIFRAHFECRDQRRFLISMHPQIAWLRPKQAVVVTVEAIVLNAAEDGLGNVITFAVLDGAERIQKTAVMRVVHNKRNDFDEPRVWQKYTSDCTNVLLGRCEDATWAIEITAQDQDSGKGNSVFQTIFQHIVLFLGLLQLTSNPKGLYFPNSYTAGTTEPVTGFYSGSCCESKLQITAIDLNNNRRTYTADAYCKYLKEAQVFYTMLLN